MNEVELMAEDPEILGVVDLEVTVWWDTSIINLHSTRRGTSSLKVWIDTRCLTILAELHLGLSRRLLRKDVRLLVL